LGSEGITSRLINNAPAGLETGLSTKSICRVTTSAKTPRLSRARGRQQILESGVAPAIRGTKPEYHMNENTEPAPNDPLVPPEPTKGPRKTMIDINELTLGQLNQLRAMLLVQCPPSQPAPNNGDPAPGTYVLVRCRDAGVHAGEFVSHPAERTVVVKNSRTGRVNCTKPTRQLRNS
jgi:hypothetical protein